MYRSLLMAAGAALVATASAQSNSGIKLTEFDLYQFSINGKPQSDLTISFPRVDFSIFGFDSKVPTLWLDYTLATQTKKDFSITLGATGAVTAARGTGGVWVNPSFQMGRLNLSGYWYYLMDDRGRTSHFIPNARLQYQVGSFKVGPELIAYTNSEGWHHRLGPTIYWDLDKFRSLRLSWLHGSGHEVRIFLFNRF
jgi:hypothetical protein